MFPLILIGVPVAIGMFIIMGGPPSRNRGAGAIIVAMIAFIVIIIGVAAIHPPGDYRSHRVTRTSASGPNL
jgi:hypothetical protein